VLLFALAAAALPPAALPTAEDLFGRVRAALLARRYPTEISYAVTVEGYDGRAWQGRTYDSFDFPARGEIRVRSLSREENADPYHPKEFGVSIFGFGTSRGADAPPDPIGVPRLSPTYAFGLVPAPRPVPVLPAPLPSGAPQLIGSAAAIAKIYTVALVGPEDVNAIPCWHLSLKPVGNPGTYRVRDIWIDRVSAELVRLKTDGNFTAKVTGKGLWTVDYARDAEGSWYLASETSDGSVETDDVSYQRMRVRFVDVKRDLREIYDVGVPSESLVYLLEP